MLPRSKFLTFFQENKQQLESSSKLIGDLLIIEAIKFPEKKIGSIIIADTSKHQINTIVGDQPTFYRVLMCGAGYFDDETGESVPLDIKPGAVILTGSISAKMFSSVPLLEVSEYGVLGITRFSDVNMYWETEQAFYDFLTGMNESVKAVIEAEKASR